MDQQQASRNLVVFCDGTGNVWGNQRDTNIVKLVRACVQDDQQIVYYDAGVGTASELPGVAWLDNIKLHWQRLMGLAFGGGIYENIASAYLFLVRHWREGDAIYVFGFSRGAFTARAVAGLVNLFGIVRPQAETVVPTLLRVYFSKALERREEAARDLSEHFASPAGRQAWVHFTGAFDTVASVGGLTSRQITSVKQAGGKRFRHVRHAVSIDEQRAPYQPRLYTDTEEPFKTWQATSLLQRWFRGVHSDVGGSYREQGLADVALVWMAGEAKEAGLRLVPGNGWAPDERAPMHDEVADSLMGGLWPLVGLQQRTLPADVARQVAADGPRAALWAGRARRRLGVLAACVLGLMLWLHHVTPGGGAGLALMQLQAWQLPAGAFAALPAEALARALWTDLALIGVYTLLLGHLVGAAFRRLWNWRRSDERAQVMARRCSHWPLVAVPLADLLENALTAWLAFGEPGTGAAFLLSGASALKLGALLAVLLFCGWAASRPQTSAGETPGSTNRHVSRMNG